MALHKCAISNPIATSEAYRERLSGQLALCEGWSWNLIVGLFGFKLHPSLFALVKTAACRCGQELETHNEPSVMAVECLGQNSFETQLGKSDPSSS